MPLGLELAGEVLRHVRQEGAEEVAGPRRDHRAGRDVVLATEEAAVIGLERVIDERAVVAELKRVQDDLGYLEDRLVGEPV